MQAVNEAVLNIKNKNRNFTTKFIKSNLFELFTYLNSLLLLLEKMMHISSSVF